MMGSSVVFVYRWFHNYVAFVLSLSVPHLSFSWYLGRAVLRDCVIFHLYFCTDMRYLSKKIQCPIPTHLANLGYTHQQCFLIVPKKKIFTQIRAQMTHRKISFITKHAYSNILKILPPKYENFE